CTDAVSCDGSDHCSIFHTQRPFSENETHLLDLSDRWSCLYPRPCTLHLFRQFAFHRNDIVCWNNWIATDISLDFFHGQSNEKSLWIWTVQKRCTKLRKIFDTVFYISDHVSGSQYRLSVFHRRVHFF